MKILTMMVFTTQLIIAISSLIQAKKILISME